MSTALGLKLAGLLARVEAATGTDRELDEALYEWSGAKPPSLTVGGGPYWKSPDDGPQHPSILVPRLTASLDASLALCERQKASGIDAAQLLHQALEDLANGGWRDDQPIGPQIALCLLAAMLRDLIAQGEAGTAEPLSRSGRK